MYFNTFENHIRHSPLRYIKVVDVTGCGDIVLCVLVYIYLKQRKLYQACKIANFIAGKAVGVIGNFQISINDISEAEKYLEDKIIFDTDAEKIQQLSLVENLVFTNGCFDIIHSAHIRLIKYAKTLGEVLVLGLNSDRSIKIIKGDKRPINNQQERAELLANLDWVDYIIIFDDTTPYSVLQNLKPSIIVKGGDYEIDKIIGKEFSQRVVLFDYAENCSTTKVIEKIIEKI
jgi:D-beta-D-heptose 7-phosphate kinase/D-beta-D-heptose 1-phosphate adenosyltransferase